MTDVAANFYVYMLFRLNGLPCYVGKGKGDRWLKHEKFSNHSNAHLGNIIKQARAAGKELPKVKVAENLTEVVAFNLERLLIGLMGRGSDGPLVNMTDGGDGPAGFKQSVESNAKRSASLKGRPRSPEHVEAAAAGQRGGTKSKGWWSTEEGRAKQAENNQGGFKPGHEHSDAVLEKIRAARARQPQHVSPETQFKPGQEAWNKGVKGLQHSPATQFKPGHVMSPETCAKLSKSVRESWVRRKAARQSSINEGAKS